QSEIQSLDRVPDLLVEMKARRDDLELRVERLRPIMGLANDVARQRAVDRQLRTLEILSTEQVESIETVAQQVEGFAAELSREPLTEAVPVVTTTGSALRELMLDTARQLRTLAENTRSAIAAKYESDEVNGFRRRLEELEQSLEIHSQATPSAPGDPPKDGYLAL